MVNNNLHTHLAITRYIIGGSWRWHGANYELLNALNPLTTASSVNDITDGAYSSVINEYPSNGSCCVVRIVMCLAYSYVII